MCAGPESWPGASAGRRGRTPAAGTARDVDIHRDDGVDAHDGRIVVVEAARAGADAEGDDPFGLGHLVVDAFEDRSHLVADRADDEEHVRLARRKSRQARLRSGRRRSGSRPWPCTPSRSRR